MAVTFSPDDPYLKRLGAFARRNRHGSVTAGENPLCELHSAMTKLFKELLFRPFGLISRDTHLDTERLLPWCLKTIHIFSVSNM